MDPKLGTDAVVNDGMWFFREHVTCCTKTFKRDLAEAERDKYLFKNHDKHLTIKLIEWPMYRNG